MYFRKLLNKIGSLQQLEDLQNKQFSTSDDYSKDMFKSIANEYNIDELFEGNVSKTYQQNLNINKSFICRILKISKVMGLKITNQTNLEIHFQISIS